MSFVDLWVLLLFYAGSPSSACSWSCRQCRTCVCHRMMWWSGRASCTPCWRRCTHSSPRNRAAAGQDGRRQLAAWLQTIGGMGLWTHNSCMRRLPCSAKGTCVRRQPCSICLASVVQLCMVACRPCCCCTCMPILFMALQARGQLGRGYPLYSTTVVTAECCVCSSSTCGTQYTE